MDGEGDWPGVTEGVAIGDSCAAATARKATQQSKVRMLKPRSEIGNLGIVVPVQVRKNAVTPFAVTEELFVEIICDKLIVQTIEPSKVINRAFSGVFGRSAGFQ